MALNERKTRAQDGIRYGSLTILARVVIAKYEPAVVSQNAVAFGKDRTEFLRKSDRFRVLDLFVMARGHQAGAVSVSEIKRLPHVKEVRQLGVIDIIKKRRVRYYQINTLVRKIGLGRAAAGQVNGAFRQAAFRVRLRDRPTDRRRDVEDLSDPFGFEATFQGNFERRFSVV